jgi:phosphoribosylformylglycinamidine synthase
LPAVRIGAADVLENTLDVQGQFRIPVRELRAAWGEPLPTHLG